MMKIVIGTVALLFLLAGCGQKKESAEPSKDTTTEALQSTLPVLENANNNTVVTKTLVLPADENGVQQSPGWSREALEFLIHERHVKAVGHETFDTDAGIPAAEHGLVNEYYLLEQNIYQVEVLNHLDQVPAVGALISIAFPHWDKATGSPVRAIAILP